VKITQIEHIYDQTARFRRSKT